MSYFDLMTIKIRLLMYNKKEVIFVNYKELDILLKSAMSYSYSTDESLYKHFEQKFEKVPFQNDFLFVFHHDREFKNKNHIISLHQRMHGKVPNHIYHYIVMTYVYSGTFTMTVEDNIVTLSQGDIIIFDKHVPHSVEATGENDLGINIILNENYFSKKFINHLPNEQFTSQFMIELMNNQRTHNHYLHFYTKKDHLVHNCIQNILCEHYDSQMCSDDLIDNYIMILITHLVRKFQYNTNLSVQLFKNQQLLSEIIHYIQLHYQDGNLTTMCHQFGYDPSYTSKLIKQFSGKTFKQLVNEERMKKTMILLQNKELPIYEIAQEVGINNLTSFYKRFQEYSGYTPQEYRNKIE